MALEMREKCERCRAALGLEDEARICSYECTFCPSCSEGDGVDLPQLRR